MFCQGHRMPTTPASFHVKLPTPSGELPLPIVLKAVNYSAYPLTTEVSMCSLSGQSKMPPNVHSDWPSIKRLTKQEPVNVLPWDCILCAQREKLCFLWTFSLGVIMLEALRSCFFPLTSAHSRGSTIIGETEAQTSRKQRLAMGQRRKDGQREKMTSLES